MRHVSVISGHLISIGFRGLTGCQREPRDRGVTLITFDMEFGMTFVDHEDSESFSILHQWNL